MSPLIRYPILQHAWFVTDLEEAAHRWHRTVGAGPFFITRNHYGERHNYRGTPFDSPLSYAFGYHGDTHVQFIQQDDSAPSIYRDMYGPGEEGFHHIAMLVPDDEVEAESACFEAAGFPVASSLWALANVVYIDTRPALGCFLEMHGDTPEIRAVFARWKDAHDTWDGVTDVVR